MGDITAVVLALLLALTAYIILRGGLTSLAPSREYKSGTGWCLWRWTKVESEYILRLHVVKTPWGAICLHWIRKPDREPWLHDHPVTFLSLVLRGGYSELRVTSWPVVDVVTHRWFNVIRASQFDVHRITACDKGALTLCFMGPKTREWGFHVPARIKAGGWIGWKEYYSRLAAGETMRDGSWMGAHRG